MATTGFDKLNSLIVTEVDKPRAMEYDKYFGEMDLTQEQIDERISAARDFEDDFLFILALIGVSVDSLTTDYTNVKQMAADRWRGTTERYIQDYTFAEQYSQSFANNAVDSTLRNIANPWFMSTDRAMFNAENEANLVLARKDFLKAVENGYTKKTWVDIRDSRERDSHARVGGKTIGIFEFFHVGDALMMYPKDTMFGNGAEHPEEVVNCRCTVRYKERIKSNDFGLKNREMYDIIASDNRGGINLDSYSGVSARELLANRIKSGAYPLIMNVEKQQRHHRETKGYINGRSYFTINMDEVHGIVLAKHLSGTIYVNDGMKQIKETIRHDKVVGYVVDTVTGGEIPTMAFTVHYSKTGYHVVPTRVE